MRMILAWLHVTLLSFVVASTCADAQSLDAIALQARTQALQAKAAAVTASRALDYRRAADYDTRRRTAYAITGTTPEKLLTTRLALSLQADRNAKDASGVLAVDGSDVASWADARTPAQTQCFASTNCFTATSAAATRPKLVQNAVAALPCVRFAGAQAMSIANNAALNPEAGEFHLWMLINGPQRFNEPLIAKGNYSSTIAGYGVFGSYTAPTSSIFARANDGTTAAGQNVLNTPGVHLVEMHFSGTAVTGAIDGQTTGWSNGAGAVTGNTYSASINPSGFPLVLGATSTVINYGRYDLCGLWMAKGALSSDELATMRRYAMALGQPDPAPAVNNYGAEQIVAQSGADAYVTRIPALALTNKGTLLAFYEARNNPGAITGDSGHIGTAVKRRLLGSTIWSSQIMVADDGVNTLGNPTPIVDRQTGRVHLLLTGNLGTDSESMIGAGTGAPRRAYYTYSDDDGATWSALRDISADVIPSGSRWFATGPGGMEQLANGRIFVPAAYTNASTARLNSGFYSDDHGATWRIGFNNTVSAGLNETSFAQNADGSLYINGRNVGGTNILRSSARSTDGGSSLSTNFGIDGGQIQTQSGTQSSLLHYGSLNGSDLLLFSGPGDSSTRALGTIWASTNGGFTWPAYNAFRNGFFAYSSMVRLPSGRVGILFEADNSAAGTIRYGEFDPAYPAFAPPTAWLPMSERLLPINDNTAPDKQAA